MLKINIENEMQDKNVLPIEFENRCIHPRPCLPVGRGGAFCSIFVIKEEEI
jgi:hypothetical protein